MTIYEERDIVLRKIAALAQTGEPVDCTVVYQELFREGRLNMDKSKSAVWYLADHKYILRRGDRLNDLLMTEKGANLVAAGGFVAVRRELARLDKLEEAVADLIKRVEGLEIRLEEPKPAKVKLGIPAPSEKMNPWLKWGSVALVVLLILVAVMTWFWPADA